MRHRPRTDGNQGVIVEALIAAGASVQILAGVGMGCPDLLVGFRGVNYLIEVKARIKPGTNADKYLTPDELKWHEYWKGQVWTVGSVQGALELIGAVERTGT